MAKGVTEPDSSLRTVQFLWTKCVGHASGGHVAVIHNLLILFDVASVAWFVSCPFRSLFVVKKL